MIPIQEPEEYQYIKPITYKDILKFILCAVGIPCLVLTLILFIIPVVQHYFKLWEMYWK